MAVMLLDYGRVHSDLSINTYLNGVIDYFKKSKITAQNLDFLH